MTVNRGTEGVSKLLILTLAGFLWSACVGCTGSGQTQAGGQEKGADGTDASPPQTQTTTSASKKRTGVWHHFGESNNPHASSPRSTGAWRRFGSASNAPTASPRGPTARQQHSGIIGTGDLEKQMYDLMNHDRLNPSNAGEAGGRAQALRWNPRLAAIARAHSRDMIQRGYFDHVDPDGKSAGDRLRAAGVPWQSVGENIAMDDSVADAESAFMSEPRFQHNHRWNILNSKYTEVGVGIVRGPDGHYYITQEFMQNLEGLESSAEDLRAAGESRQSTGAVH
ncbi:MAG TPA: CAP domain-containing protein [Terriglobia bacterium]|nr:CAP domain-containing protein [Terriglobia bacterium]